MPFSPVIRNRVLVDSARHCAVCHRFKHVGVEVHHIQPESEEGLNTYENAICLCFDCHTAAGHYNDAHPKGTKYSRGELTLARERLYRLVREGKIGQISETNASVLFRYVLCASPTALLDLVDNAAEKPSIGKFQLLQNKRLQEMLFAFENYQTRRAPGHFYESFEALNAAHPEFGNQTSRSMNVADIKEGEFGNAFLERMVDNGIDPASIGTIEAHYNECGNPCWIQELVARQLVGFFLQIVNDSRQRIKIDSLLGFDTTANNFTRLDSAHGNPTTSRIAPCVLDPDSSLVIPLGTLFGPLENEPNEGIELSRAMVSDEQGESLSLVHCDASALEWYGALTQVQGVGGSIAGEELFFECHEFGKAPGLYRIDRHWFCGSCPYVACQDSTTGTWYVLCETLSKSPTAELAKTYSISLPKNTSKIRIVEAEYETTHITSICVDGKKVMGGATLKHGDSIDIDVAGATKLGVTGYYVAVLPYPVTADHRMQKRRQLRKLQNSLNIHPAMLSDE
jgi:HNH endonuclease